MNSQRDQCVDQPKELANPQHLAPQGRHYDGLEALRNAQVALHESEERLRFALEATTDGLWDWDIPSGKVYFSPQWARLLGYDPQEVPQRVEFFFTLLHPEDIPRIRKVLDDHFAGITVVKQDEVQLRTKSGEYKWFYDRGKVVTRDASGTPIRMVGTITDITQRKDAEAALAASERELRLITNKTPGIVSRVDRSLRYLFVNEMYEQIFNRRREDIIGSTMQEVLGEALFNDVRDYIDQVLSGVPVSFESKYLDHTGLVHDALVNYVPDFNVNKEVTGFFVMAFNITDLRRAEAAVRVSDVALKSISQGVIIADRDGRILSLNRAFTTITGYQPEEVLHRPCAEVLAHFQDPQTLPHLLEAKSHGIEFSTEVLDRRRDGSLFWNDLTLSPVRDHSGTLTHYITVIRDVTERRRLEEQLRRSQRMEAIGHLAGGVAHDFNNILAAVFGNAELALQNCPDSDPNRPCLQEILTACARGKSMIQQILAFSRQQPQQRRVIHLAPVIQETVNLLRVTLPSSVQIRVDLSPDTPEVLADPTQIHQVLVNLCTNAWHAIGDKPGVIEIILDRLTTPDRTQLSPGGLPAGQHARITVRDNGQGILPENLERIFDPFFTTKDHGKGTGLGLAMVMGILQAHEGTVGVESQPGLGTTFCIQIPASLSNTKAPTPPPSHAQRGSGQRILFLDDEPSLVSVASRMLRHLGYVVDAFENPEEALRQFHNRPTDFSLVITDHNMPGQTGLQVAEQIHAAQPDLPILLCSGRISDELSEQASHVGIRELLHKPVAMDELHSAIGRVLSSKHG
jgi:PAS domain S-box-containing protein